MFAVPCKLSSVHKVQLRDTFSLEIEACPYVHSTYVTLYEKQTFKNKPLQVFQATCQLIRKTLFCLRRSPDHGTVEVVVVVVVGTIFNFDFFSR